MKKTECVCAVDTRYSFQAERTGKSDEQLRLCREFATQRGWTTQERQRANSRPEEK